MKTVILLSAVLIAHTMLVVNNSKFDNLGLTVVIPYGILAGVIASIELYTFLNKKFPK